MQYESENAASTAPSNFPVDLELAGIQGRRALRLLRVSAGLLAALLVITTIWLTPWLSIGMSTEDFNVATGVALALVAALGLGTAAIALHWAPLFTEEPKSELLRALMGEPLAIRGKARFINRLRFQCEEGLRGRNRTFSLAVIRILAMERGTPEGDAVASAAIGIVRDVIRTVDVLGDPQSNEVWVLLSGSVGEGSRRACERIASALGEGLPARGDGVIEEALRIGWGAFEVDGRDPETLFRVARQRAVIWTSGDGGEVAA
jgi:hypothetical protein